MTEPVLIFDLDGTLVDSAPDLTHALNWTLTEAGLPEVGLDEVRHMVGLGARRLIEQGAENHGPPLAPARIDALLESFLDYYERNLCIDTRMFAGVGDVVATLGKTHALGICTNKPEMLAVELVETLGLRPHFPVILGGDSLPFRKPDGRHINETRKRLNPEAGAIMIGDSIADIEGAKSAGVPVIAVSFGYSTIPVTHLGPDIVVDHFSDIPAAIEELKHR